MLKQQQQHQQHPQSSQRLSTSMIRPLPLLTAPQAQQPSRAVALLQDDNQNHHRNRNNSRYLNRFRQRQNEQQEPNVASQLQPEKKKDKQKRSTTINLMPSYTMPASPLRSAMKKKVTIQEDSRNDDNHDERQFQQQQQVQQQAEDYIEGGGEDMPDNMHEEEEDDELDFIFYKNRDRHLQRSQSSIPQDNSLTNHRLVQDEANEEQPYHHYHVSPLSTKEKVTSFLRRVAQPPILLPTHNENKKNEIVSRYHRQQIQLLIQQQREQQLDNENNYFLCCCTRDTSMMTGDDDVGRDADEHFLGQKKMTYDQFCINPHSVLRITYEDGIPSPDGPDHVILQIQASTVSIHDCMIRRGYDLNILNPITLPMTPGCDVVGYVIAMGSKVYGFEEGDHVAALLQHGGGNARYISIASSQLIKIPKYDHNKMMKKQQKNKSNSITTIGSGIMNQFQQYKNIDSAEAVAMITVYATAYQVLKKIQQDGPMFTLQDKKVLIYMGYYGPILSDPIGYALIQMCHKAKASIFVVIHHHEKYSYYKNRMKVIPLPYDEQEQWKQLIEHKMDYVFDGYCDNGLQTSYSFLKKDKGEVICYGYTSMFHSKSTYDNGMGLFGAPLYRGHWNQFYVTNCYPKDRVKFVYRTSSVYESYLHDPTTYQKNLKSLFQLLLLHKIKPKISYQIPLQQVPWAQQQYEVSSTTGPAEAQTDAHYDQYEGGIIVCLPWMKHESVNKKTKTKAKSNNSPKANKSERNTVEKDSGIHDKLSSDKNVDNDRQPNRESTRSPPAKTSSVDAGAGASDNVID